MRVLFAFFVLFLLTRVSREYILSSHTIQALLSLASETTQAATRDDCENCLNLIRRTGGNHKLKLDADLNMYLPEVVRQGIGEAVQRCESMVVFFCLH